MYVHDGVFSPCSTIGDRTAPDAHANLLIMLMEVSISVQTLEGCFTAIVRSKIRNVWRNCTAHTQGLWLSSHDRVGF